jgi:hypothetical protein
MGTSKKKKKKKGKKKLKWKNINTPFLIMGIAFILMSFIDTSTYVENKDIIPLQITLSTDIQIIKGRKSTNSYKFWAEEYAALFVIENGIHPFREENAQERFTKGSKIEVSIPKGYDVENKLKKIPVYSLSRNGKDYLTLKEYNMFSGEYSFRLRFFAFSGGVFILLSALSLANRKQLIALGVLFAIAVLLMNIFEIGIYS